MASVMDEEGYQQPVLGRLFGALNSAKRGVKDFIANPLDSLDQIAGTMQDKQAEYARGGLPALESKGNFAPTIANVDRYNQDQQKFREEKDIERGLDWVGNAPGALAGVVKKIGPQQWLRAKDSYGTGGIGETISSLQRPNSERMSLVYPNVPEASRAEWLRNLQQTDPYVYQEAIDYPIINAVNAWTEGPLANYIKGQGGYKNKGMATPGDAIRELADQGILYHNFPESSRSREMWAIENRQKGGFPEAPMAQTEAGKRWEDLTDSMIDVDKAGEEQRRMKAMWRDNRTMQEAGSPKLTAEQIAEQEALQTQKMLDPWVMKVPPETMVYDFSGAPYDINRLQFGHLQDLLDQRIRSGELRPEQASKVSVEDMVRYADDIRKKGEAAQAKDQSEVYKKVQEHNAKRIPEIEYANVELPPEVFKNPATGEMEERAVPPGSLQWHKYDSSVPDEELKYGLSVDSCLLGHCVGGVGHGEHGYDRYVPMRSLITGKPVKEGMPDENSYFNAVKRGDMEIHSLRDSHGRAHATIEVIPAQTRQTLLDQNPAELLDLHAEELEPIKNKILDEHMKFRSLNDRYEYMAEQLKQLHADDPNWLNEVIQPRMINQIKGFDNDQVHPMLHPYVMDMLNRQENKRVEDLYHIGSPDFYKGKVRTQSEMKEIERELTTRINKLGEEYGNHPLVKKIRDAHYTLQDSPYQSVPGMLEYRAEMNSRANTDYNRVNIPVGNQRYSHSDFSSVFMEPEYTARQTMEDAVNFDEIEEAVRAWLDGHPVENYK
jgi:polyhydroxyalkanoate synthesis regulator phasin